MRKIIPYNQDLIAYAKKLRKNMTLGEIALWREIKFIEVRIHNLQTCQDIVVTGKVNAGVRGVVILFVKVGELFKGEIRDDSRVTSTVDSIGCVGEHGALGFPVEKRVSRRVDTLHFVENNSLVDEGIFLVFKF